MSDQAKRHDLPTMIAIAAIAGVVSTQLHEALGHGGTCLALGGRIAEWGAFYVNCDVPAVAPPMIARLVAAAGSTINLLTALVAFALLRATPERRPRARFFWWLMFAIGG